MARGPPDGSLLDHPLVAERYFFPRRASFPSPLAVDVPGARLACSLHRVDDPGALTIVHFHGNGEVVADYLGDFAERIGALGCNLLLAEYRGYGMSTGEPRLGTMLGDVAAIVRAAGAPPERIVLFGRSVGSIFALEGAARFPGVAGLVLESAIADPLERLLLRVDPGELGASPEDFAAAVEARLDHRAKIGAYRGPVLLVHGLLDDLVPVSNARRLATWAAGTVTPRYFERGDHNSVLVENEEEYFEAVAEFVAKVRSPR